MLLQAAWFGKSLILELCDMCRSTSEVLCLWDGEALNKNLKCSPSSDSGEGGAVIHCLILTVAIWPLPVGCTGAHCILQGTDETATSAIKARDTCACGVDLYKKVKQNEGQVLRMGSVYRYGPPKIKELRSTITVHPCVAIITGASVRVVPIRTLSIHTGVSRAVIKFYQNKRKNIERGFM